MPIIPQKMTSVPNVKPVVVLTNCNMEKLSRHDLLNWINDAVRGQYAKIEELCSGVAYCQLMEQLFPHCIGLRRIKVNAKLEHEYLHNLRLFQAAFARLNFDKSVPIDRMIKGRFQDNFEFLQWFKKFYDSNSVGKENQKGCTSITSATKLKEKQKSTPPPLSTANHMHRPQLRKANSVGKSKPAASVAPYTHVLQEDLNQLAMKVNAVKKERDFYLKKLSTIEVLLKKSKERNEHVCWSQRALNVLYAINDDSTFIDEEIAHSSEAAEL